MNSKTLHQHLRTPRRYPVFPALVALSMLGWGLTACDSTPTADVDPDPTTGTLTVNVVTTGVDLGAGYALFMDGQSRAVSPNETVTFPDVAVGPHTLELSDHDYNCRVTDGPLGPVSVQAGQSVTVRYVVECRVKEIVFISGRDGNFEAYWSSVSGAGQTRFMELPGSKEDELAWSPDGSKIAGATDVSGDFEIFTVDPLGQNMTNLTRSPTTVEGMPSWHPLGTQIAYRRFENGNEDVWVMDADGSDQQPLVATPAMEKLPDWSPDGEWIAYVSNEDGSEDIWIHELATRARIRLTPIDGFADTWPSWSPDGERLAFASDRDGDLEIYVMNRDGSNPVNLSNTPGSNEWLPKWSPDGKYLTFNTDRDGVLDIYWMKADGSDVEGVATSSGHDFFATWNPAPWPL